jgi:hypothetical protein
VIVRPDQVGSVEAAQADLDAIREDRFVHRQNAAAHGAKSALNLLPRALV